MISGIVAIDKPAGFTSFDVIAKLRGIMKFKKLGHAGTLDPMATGVLPVFVGRATKACDVMPDSTKSYSASFELGITTDTLDITGRVISSDKRFVKGSEVSGALDRFRGEIDQTPPMFSAVSVNGKRLYELAREGKTIERASRKVTVNSLELCEFDEESQSGKLEIDCSKGTFVRSIVSDLGETLGCGAVLTGLVRTRSGEFELSDCVTLEKMQEIADSSGDFSQVITPVERVFCKLPQIKLCGAQTRMFLNGVKLDLDKIAYSHSGGQHRVFGDSGEFLGLGAPDEQAGVLRISKMFCGRE